MPHPISDAVWSDKYAPTFQRTCQFYHSTLVEPEGSYETSLHFHQATRCHKKVAVFNVTSARGKISYFVSNTRYINSRRHMQCPIKFRYDHDGRTGSFLLSSSWHILVIRRETRRGTNSNPARQNVSLRGLSTLHTALFEEALQSYKEGTGNADWGLPFLCSTMRTV